MSKSATGSPANQFEGKHPGAQASTPKTFGKAHKPDRIGFTVNKSKRTEKNGA